MVMVSLVQFNSNFTKFESPLGALDCDASTNVLVGILCVVGLVVSFAGYRLYLATIGTFAFAVAFAAESAIGFSWLAKAPGQEEIPKKIVIVMFCLLWGIIAAVLAHKLAHTIHRFLGFVMGAIMGAAAVFAIVYCVKDPVDDQIGEAYLGWNDFVVISLSFPVALLTGYLARNSIMYLIMLATAVVGSAAAVASLEQLLDCAEVDMEAITRPITVIIMAVVALIGFGTQVYTKPKPKEVGLPQ
jgi:hypothetical protein